jgi:hypothetical protein
MGGWGVIKDFQHRRGMAATPLAPPLTHKIWRTQSMRTHFHWLHVDTKYAFVKVKQPGDLFPSNGVSTAMAYPSLHTKKESTSTSKQYY